jgi:hypothetical protein
LTSCNQPKSLSGIESFAIKAINFEQVAINLNPYQGLKLNMLEISCFLVKVAINLNPYQGLKQKYCSCLATDNAVGLVAINLNPYQGLKRRIIPLLQSPTT